MHKKFKKAQFIAAGRQRAEKPVRQASGTQHALLTKLQNYFVQHIRVAITSLGRLWRTPVSSLLTIAVIGIAIALPVALTLLLDNAQSLTNQWEGTPQISLFLIKDTDPAQIDDLKQRIRARADVADLSFISAKQALEEFSELSGFGNAVDVLPTNPLPPVIVIKPETGSMQPESVKDLHAWLLQQPEVELAQLDMQWLERLHTMMQIAYRGIAILGTLLGIAVILIIGNTIRLEIQNRHEEIEVTRLIGATKGFIRRPFLYTGIWYGLSGGVIAGILVEGSFWMISSPIDHLSKLYSSEFQLEGIHLYTLFKLLFASTFLGWAGSLLAVGRHLYRADPH